MSEATKDLRFDWKQRAEAAFAPLRSMHRSWLPAALRKNEGLLDAGMLTVAARRLIFRHLLLNNSRAARPFELPMWVVPRSIAVPAGRSTVFEICMVR